MCAAVLLSWGCAPERPPTLSLKLGDVTYDYATLAQLSKPVDVDTEDPVYGRFKHYRAFRLLPLLEKAFGDKKTIQDKQFIIGATDGYAIPATGDVLTQDGAYLAFRDREHVSWEPIGPRKLAPGPLYLVWTGAAQRDTSAYPWPYAIASIEVVASLASLYPATMPPGDDPGPRRGHEIFLHHCIKCHAINRQGGSVGPELNVPKNVTEYWPIEQIKAYVKNPASFRYGAMPAHPDLTDDDLTALTDYLVSMKGHKQDQ